MKKLINKKLKGFSMQSIIIGSVIVGVIAMAGIAYSWYSAEESRINMASQTVKEQILFIESHRHNSFSTLEAWHKAGDGDEDYLDEIILNSGLSQVETKKIFRDPSALWEIRQVNDQTFNKTFFIHIETNYDDDYKFWEKVLKKTGVTEGYFNLTYNP